MKQLMTLADLFSALGSAWVLVQKDTLAFIYEGKSTWHEFAELMIDYGDYVVENITTYIHVENDNEVPSICITIGSWKYTRGELYNIDQQ